MFPSACGGSVGTTGEAVLKLFGDAVSKDFERPLRSHYSRLSRGEKHDVSLQHGGSVVSATGEAVLKLLYA